MRFPHVPQLDRSDCGAACLAMIGQYYKKVVGVARIREMAFTDTEGTNFLGMIKAAEELGFTAKAIKLDTEEVSRELPVPFIAHVYVERSNLFHFVCVYRIRDRYVWVSDPARGRRKLNRTEFSGWWTGAAVLMAPGHDLSTEKGYGGPLSRFLPLLWRYRRQFLEVAIVSGVLFFLNISQFLYFRFLVDEIVPGGMYRALHAMSIGMLIVVLLRVLMNMLRQYVLSHVGNRIDMTIVFAYLSHVLRLPFSFFDRRRVGEIVTRLDDARQIRQILSGATLSMFVDSFMIIGVGVFLFTQSPTLTAISLATVPIYAAIVFGFHKPLHHNNKRVMSLNADSHSHMVESFSTVFTVKAMNHERRSFHQAESKFLATIQQKFRLEVLGNFQGGMIQFVEGAGRIFLFWAGGYQILQGALSLGQLISFNVLMGQFIGPLKRVLTMQPELQRAAVAARRIIEIHDLSEESESEQPLLEPRQFSGKIDFYNVGFRYGTRRSVLTDVSFSVAPGERIGIVGGSGSGKSTIIKLLLKFYSPEQGHICIDDVDVEDLDTSALRGAIGYVPQEVHLFNGTVRQNLLMRNPAASAWELLNACRSANILDFIMGLPDRFETVVGEHGANLSGGERQRFAIARALIGDPKILLFDEATSALDSATEASVQDTIRDLSEQDITTIIIAHRLASVVDRDKILVMEQGQIREAGSHSELLAGKGAYYQLCAKQGLVV